MAPAQDVREECVREMDAKRGFGTTWLREAFLAVPREHFVPDRVWWPDPGPDGRCPLLDRTRKPRAWLKAVYLPGVPLITQIDDGAVPPDGPASGAWTSSISSPGVVIEMLRHLALGPGDRVLEIGTGTGYNTALLAHRTGTGRLTSIEIDPEVADRARTALHGLGLHPRLRCGDGEDGHTGDAPYDRVLATASVRRVPYAWIQQLRPGGVLLLPLDSPFGHDLLVRLTADGEGRAQGRPVARVEFMRTRGQRGGSASYTELGWPEGLDPEQWEDLRIEVGVDGQCVTVADRTAGAAAVPAPPGP
ncbi:methyltransferase domain-containing protein [Streptomyces daliensis]